MTERRHRFARFLDAVLAPVLDAVEAETGCRVRFAAALEVARPPRAEPPPLSHPVPPAVEPPEPPEPQPEPLKPPKAKRPRPAKPSSEGRAKPRARRAKAGNA